MATQKYNQLSRCTLDVANCTGANLRKATRMVTQVYDAALRPSGLRATQFSLIAALTKTGDIPLTKLADLLAMDRTTLTRNLKPLTANGYIRVVQNDDQRVRVISLTEEGIAVFKNALPAWKAVQSRLVKGMGKAGWSRFLDDLGALIETTQKS